MMCFWHVLEFSDQVNESRLLAVQAALDVPGVQQKVAEAEESITSITEELNIASDKAKDARDLAQQAQKEFADKASEVYLHKYNTDINFTKVVTC